jgi:hypothetical protein
MNTVAFFNFGNSCILELLVATYSLRQVYNGSIVWLLNKNDKWNEILAKQVDKLNVDIHWVNFKGSRRNKKCSIKPMLFNYLFDKTKYESVLMCDGDLLFLKSFDELWIPLKQKGCVLTQFCDWKTNGSIMKGRIKQCLGVLSQEQVDKMCDKYPAVNIGIMGFNKENGKKALRKWGDVTNKLAGKHIIDEICASLIPVWYSCYVAPPIYNASAKHSDLDKIENNIIVHYHGGSFGGGEVDLEYDMRRRSSRLWMAHLGKFYESNIVENAKMWEEFAKGGIKEIFLQNPNLINECRKEFNI